MSTYDGRRAKAWRTRRHLAGGGSVLADAEPLRPILHELRSRMSWTSVALLCGTTSHRHVREIADGTVRRINHDMAAAIRAAAGQTPMEGGSWVSSLGARRRLQALIALGYTVPQLSEASGYSQSPMKAVIRGEVDVIRADTHALVCDLFERLCMRMPTAATKHERAWVKRQKARAVAEGWPPPLAWDDIDDPAEQPTGVGYVNNSDRPGAIRDAVAMGWDAHETCRRLETSWDALEKWCARNDLRDEWRTLVARTGTRGANQHTEVA